MAKITRDQVAARLEYIEEQLAQLTPLAVLYRSFRSKFGTTRRCAERYVKRVHDRWASEAAPSRASKRAEIEAAADLTFRDARAAKNQKTMASVLELKAKLHGLYRPEQTDDGDGGDIELVFECEAPPADRVPVAPDVAPDGDLPGH